MSDDSKLALVLLFAFSAAGSLIAVPFFRNGALRFGLVDAPDGRRKHQTKPIPRAGGLAVLSVVLATLGIAVGVSEFMTYRFPARDNFQFPASETLLALVLGSLVIGLVGLLDDWRGLRGRHKLVGQMVAIAIFLLPTELHVEKISFLNYEIELGRPLGLAFTIFWMLGAINALNLIDGMDGLLGSISFMTCLTFVTMALMMNNLYIAVISCVLAGAVIGFLRYNLPPATVYLGDCGSMSLGYFLGAPAIQGTLKAPAVATFGIPIALLVLPIFDTTAAILRRKLTGRSIYTTDRGHLHHCLQRSGLSRQSVLLLVGGFMLTASVGVIVSVYRKNELYALLAASAIMASLVATRLFGNAELRLLKERLRAIVSSVVRGRSVNQEHEIEVRLQGSAGWNEVWLELTLAARGMRLQKLWLDINAPALHESYHARWDRYAGQQENPSHWKAEIPLFYDGIAIGRLTAVGQPDSDPMWDKLATLARTVEHTERCMTTVTQQHVEATRPAAAAAEPVLASAGP